MPHAACFLDIVLEPAEHIEIDASDLECFYYTARVSSERAARNVFGRPLRASMLAKCFWRSSFTMTHITFIIAHLNFLQTSFI